MITALLLVATGLAQAQELSKDSNGECWDHGEWYVDIGDEVGVRGFGSSKGVNLNDFDGDGRTDILLAMGPARIEGAGYYSGENLLFIQQPDGSYVESGQQMGLDSLCEDRAPLRGDLDGDGLPDIYMTVNGHNVLYRNEGWTWYEDVTAWGGAAAHPGWGHQGLLLDADGDGWLDVFFSNGPEDGSGASVLLRNQRDGSFRDVTAESGIDSSTSGEGVCLLDVNGDQLPDIFQTNGRGHHNQLFVSQGDGTYRDEAIERGLVDPLRRFSFGAACGDLDNDGDSDIVVMTHDYMYSGNLVLENLDGFFVDVGLSLGADDESEAALRDRIDPHGLALVDLDNDGLLDIVMSGMVFEPHVFVNQGGMDFHRACDGAGIRASDLLSWSVAASDLTQDGYPEVYISSGLSRRPNDDHLFRYNGPAENHWLGVRPIGLTHNRSAIGARIEVVTAGGTVTRSVGSWSNFQSQGTDATIVGLGPHDEAELVRVTFTNGAVVELDAVPADQVLVVEEPVDWQDEDFDGVPDDWDQCPGTRVGRLTDGDGCAVGQRGGLAVVTTAPEAYGVVTDCFEFTWQGDVDASAVVQVSGDGTFGVTERIDLGPVTGGSLEVCGDTLDALRGISDGTRPLVWRVALASDDGKEALSLPSAFYMALPQASVTMPRGASVFTPSHIVVDQGTVVTWWNDSVNNGNLQNELHDVQLLDPSGAALSPFHELVGGAYATWTFNQPGVYHYICHMHSGSGSNGDYVLETQRFHHRTDGPYRCMAGTVTIR